MGWMWWDFIQAVIHEGPLNREIKHLAPGLETLLYGGDGGFPLCLRWQHRGIVTDGYSLKKIIGDMLIYNLVLVSGVQQSDSVTHIFNLFQILFPYRLLQNIEYRRSCSVIYFLYWSYVYVHLKLLMYPCPQSSPMLTINLFQIVRVCFCFVNKSICVILKN